MIYLKVLIIAEKPSLMREIQNAYNIMSTKPFDAEFTCFHGHLMQLQEPADYKKEWGKPWHESVLPMIPEKFVFVPKTECRSDVGNISKRLHDNHYDFVVNACDADREGEAIFWSFYKNSRCGYDVKRLWSSDITAPSLQKAINSLRDYKTDQYLCNLRNASFCRMFFDWLTGMNFSRAVSLRLNKLTPIGRVQTPTLNLIVQRDLEIENFHPVNYYEIQADFKAPEGNYSGLWFNPKDNNNNSFHLEEEAKDILKKLGKNGRIDSISKNEVKENAPALFNLADLQKEANSVYGFTAQQTLNTAQSLYEVHKILSYPRTASTVLSKELAKEIVKHIDAVKNVPEIKDVVKKVLSDKTHISEVMKNKKYVNDKAVVSHTALIPTTQSPDLSRLNDREYKVYMLVVKRLLAVFLDPYIVDRTTIVTDVSGEKFKTTGSVVKQMGFKSIYAFKKTDEILPNIKKGEDVNADKYSILTKKTQPPKPYNDKTLIIAMQQAGKFSNSEEFKEILNDSNGIGTEATRAGIIENIIQKGLCERKGRSIISTAFGKYVITSIKGKEICSPDLTAEWENKLRKMEDGKIKVSDFITNIKKYTSDETADLLKTLKSEKRFSGTPIGICPKCGKPAVETKNYIMCSNYKNDKTPCNFIFKKQICEKKLTENDIKKILDGKETRMIKFKSKAGKPFEAALCYNSSNGKVEFVFKNSKTSKGSDNTKSKNENTGLKCPKCGGNIIETNFGFNCDKCKFFIYKKLCGGNLSKEDINDLLKHKETKTKTFSKNGKPWYAKLKYNNDFTKLNFNFQKKP